MTKKCKSRCVELPREKCYKGCVFTDHCRLSSKYKMDPINCKLMLRTVKSLPSKKIRRTMKIGTKLERITPLRMPEKVIVEKSYSPEINKLLVQSRYSTKYDVFQAITNCMKIDVAEYKMKDSILKYYINPQVQLKSGECVSYWNKDAQKMFLDNLSKHHNIDVSKLIVPKQSYYNCWFNTGFMMNYISDKGRKFNKYFRQFMITGKMKGIKPFLKKLKAPLFLFNIAIEATLQGNPLAKIMNTNDLIEKIHENIPKEYKPYITNVKEYGNPYNYQISLLNYLSNHVYNLNHGYKSMKTTGFVHSNSDIIWAELMDNDSKEIDYKEVYIIDQNKHKYSLDSILVRDVSKQHFCSLLTINDKEYMYDGASSPSLKSIQWKNTTFLNQNVNFKMDSQSTIWNMRNGYQVLNYYRI